MSGLYKPGKNGRNYVPNGTNKTKVILRRRQLKNGDWNWEGLGADFMLQGTINSIVDSYKKEQVVYYQVDLELTNLETNEVVWMGDKKIKKQVSDRAL